MLGLQVWTSIPGFKICLGISFVNLSIFKSIDLWSLSIPGILVCEGRKAFSWSFYWTFVCHSHSSPLWSCRLVDMRSTLISSFSHSLLKYFSFFSLLFFSSETEFLCMNCAVCKSNWRQGWTRTQRDAPACSFPHRTRINSMQQTTDSSFGIYSPLGLHPEKKNVPTL